MRRGDGCQHEKNNSDNAKSDDKMELIIFRCSWLFISRWEKNCYRCSKVQTLMPEFKGHNKNKFGRKDLPDKAHKYIKIYHNQSGTKWGVGSQHTFSHFSALSAYFNNFWQNVGFFIVSRRKKVLFNCFATKQCWGTLKMWVSLSHSGSDSLSVSLWFVNQSSSHCRALWAISF